MDWDALGAVAETVSALGVIITLIYLAIQIRDSNRESRISANCEIAREYNSFLQHMTMDAELSGLWAKVWSGAVDELSEDDDARILMLTGIIMRILENAYLQFRAGRMDQDSWNSYLRILERGATAPHFKKYMDRRDDMHTAEFINLASKLISSPAGRNVFE